MYARYCNEVTMLHVYRDTVITARTVLYLQHQNLRASRACTVVISQDFTGRKKTKETVRSSYRFNNT